MKDLHKNFLSTLGLASRAGKTVKGTQLVCDALKEKKVFVVVIADDNSPNTEKRLRDRCAFYKIKLIESRVGAVELGASVGHSGPSAAVAVTDASLAKAVEASYERYISSVSGDNPQTN